MPKNWALGIALAMAIGSPFAVQADDVTIPDEYSKLIQQRSRIGMLSGDFFGDRVGLATGSLEIVQTDIDLPGNNALQVRLGRRFEAGGNHYGKGHFSYWDLDIPHLHGVFYSGQGWVVAAGSPTDAVKRCSGFFAPPETTNQGGTFSADEFWQGNSLYLPGSGDQELLLAPATSGDVPADGHTYPVITREGAAARCTTSLAATSESGSTGEGFEVVTPDGTTYRFDQMASRLTDRLTKPNADPESRARATQSGATGKEYTTNAASDYFLPRREYFLFPTRITDRFGNTVTYTWSATNPWRLMQISASDGRHLDFTYSTAYPAEYTIETISDGTRTWTYGFDTLTQPDGGIWQFNMANLYSARATPISASCDSINNSANTYTGTITAPSGALVQYTLTVTLFGRSWVPRGCRVVNGQDVEARDPNLFTGLALTAKTITGPGLPSPGGLTWTYQYGPANNCWDPASVSGSPSGAVLCTVSSPVTRTTTVTTPDGVVNRYTFGNKYNENEGLATRQEFGVSGSTALRVVDIAYASPTAAPYAAHNGTSMRNIGDYEITGLRRPQLSVTTTQQGETFSWIVPGSCSGAPCFDARARPTSVVRQGINTPASTQTEVTAYDDDTVHWVLGQVAQRTVSGLVASQTTFDANHRPWKLYSFGKLKQTLTYNTDGTLATVKDGNDNVTAFSNWKRGIPQSVLFPATPEAPSGATRSAVVNDQGWITSVTDENGYATGYGYDAMGRVDLVTPPTGDSVTWASTSSAFVPVATAENGVAAGHWRETISTGNARKVTLFDAFWRPVLVHEYDTGNAGTDRYVATAYDAGGRVADVSYPLGSAPTQLSGDGTWQLGGVRPNGVRTSYDALDRPTTVKQDSELGVLTTTTAYLTDFQRRVTDARSHATTEQFMAWDSPSFDWPVQIDAPEGQRTTIARDAFGKPTQITRGATP